MLVFDQLKKDDPQLRFIAFVTLGGLLVLLAGLWWVQVVSTKYYRDKLEGQSIRTVRIPAVRGKILDRDGHPLAENRPNYGISLYLEELSRNYQASYTNTTNAVRQFLSQQAAAKQKELGRELTPVERRQFAFSTALKDQLSRQVRYEVTSNLLAQLGSRLKQPLDLSEKNFDNHYQKARAIPLPVLTNLNEVQIAMFEEHSLHAPYMELEAQSIRAYPNGTVAAHLLGYLVRNNDSGENERTGDYNYRLDDYTGVSGIEKLFNAELRGTAGTRSVLVNNLGYRQSETILSPAEPGQDVTLTLDLDIQKAADKALDAVREDIHGAVVVMDVRNGDIFAMASSPTYNPNHFVSRPQQEIWAQEYDRWTNKDREVQLNHAAQGWYAPGSIFKIVVSMAGLELGTLNPKESFFNPGFATVGNRIIKDTAKEGYYDFDQALAESSNTYFITNGLKPGVLRKMIELGQRLHFGERTGALIPEQEYKCYFPSQKDIASRAWHDGNTANLCIGQEKLAVTPLQVAVMISAVANGGTIFYPRLVSRIVPFGSDSPSQTFPSGRVRDSLGVSQRTLSQVHEGMLMDVENPNGTGKGAAVNGFRIAGKTGTAEVEKNGRVDKSAKITWFASFGPIENPRYAVVVMVVSGVSGGTTCAPIAHTVYEAIQIQERRVLARTSPLAEIQK